MWDNNVNWDIWDNNLYWDIWNNNVYWDYLRDYLGLFFGMIFQTWGYVMDVLDVIGIMGIYCGWLRNSASPKGWLKSLKPINNGMFTTYQLVQDFATIHRMRINLQLQ